MNPGVKRLQPIYGKNKHQLVVEALTLLAKDIGVGGKLPTMAELSRRMNVAIGTLDACLKTMEARGTIYRKQGSGIYVTPRVSQKRVGLVFGRNPFSPGTSQFYSIMLDRCIAKAREHTLGFSFYLDLCRTSDEIGGGTSLHEDLVNALEERKLDGLLLVSRDQEEEEWLLRQGVPVVTLGDYSINSYWVATDPDRLVEIGVESLVYQGCKSIGLLGVSYEDGQSMRRALKKYGIPLHRDLIQCPTKDCYLDYDRREKAGHDGILQILGDGDRNSKPTGAFPDGLVITDDMITRGACAQIDSLGWVIGKNIKIASHSNKGSLALAEWDNDMTLLEIDPLEIVDALFGLLEALMAGIEPPARGILCKPVLKSPVARTTTGNTPA